MRSTPSAGSVTQSGRPGANHGASTRATEKSGCSFKKRLITPSFSSGENVQVEYTSRPPGRSICAAVARISV